jgi:hypothetical protein
MSKKAQGAKNKKFMVPTKAEEPNRFGDLTLFAQFVREKWETKPVLTVFNKTKKKWYFKNAVSRAFAGKGITTYEAKVICSALGICKSNYFVFTVPTHSVKMTQS